jgi:hypothetical protein
VPACTHLAQAFSAKLANSTTAVWLRTPQEAWFYVSLLTIGYMISRGLAKSGSRDFYGTDARDPFDANH